LRGEVELGPIAGGKEDCLGCCPAIDEVRQQTVSLGPAQGEPLAHLDRSGPVIGADHGYGHRSVLEMSAVIPRADPPHQRNVPCPAACARTITYTTTTTMKPITLT